MKHFVVNAPNYHVQPVTVTAAEEAAIAAAKDFTRGHNTWRRNGLSHPGFETLPDKPIYIRKR